MIESFIALKTPISDHQICQSVNMSLSSQWRYMYLQPRNFTIVLCNNHKRRNKSYKQRRPSGSCIRKIFRIILDSELCFERCYKWPIRKEVTQEKVFKVTVFICVHNYIISTKAFKNIEYVSF